MILFVNWMVPFLVGLVIFLITGWFTGSDEYGGVRTKDDERSQLIKQKAIVSSWLFLLMFFVVNFVFDFFNLRKEGLNNTTFVYPELLYFLLAVVSYFAHYWIYSRRMSANEK